MTDACKGSIFSLQPDTARRMNVTSSFAPWRKPSQRLVRGMKLRQISGSAPQWRRTLSSIRPGTDGRSTSPAPCSMMAKHQCFGLGSGLEVKRASTPEKPWLTSSLPSMAFNWQTRNGVKQPRAKAQTTSKLALGTGRRTGGTRPRSVWPKPWLSTRSQKSSLRFTKSSSAHTSSTRRSCGSQSCIGLGLKCERIRPGTHSSRCTASR